MNLTRNTAFILLAALIATSIVIAIPVARAAEPNLENVLDTVGFPLRTLILTETFAAGTYNITMYAEYAGYRDSNQLKWYKVGTSTFGLIFDGPEGIPRLVQKAGSLDVEAFSGPEIRRVVRVSGPAGQADAHAEGRQVEDLLPCSAVPSRLRGVDEEGHRR